jgi:hypothetical protein
VLCWFTLCTKLHYCVDEISNYCADYRIEEAIHALHPERCEVFLNSASALLVNEYYNLVVKAVSMCLRQKLFTQYETAVTVINAVIHLNKFSEKQHLRLHHFISMVYFTYYSCSKYCFS